MVEGNKNKILVMFWIIKARLVALDSKILDFLTTALRIISDFSV